MEEFWRQYVETLVNRVDGPLHFRFIVQPLMAIVFAVVDGLRDARTCQPAYFWAVLTSKEHRRKLLKDGWKHFGKIFILAIALDVIYQFWVHHTIYPGQSFIIAVVLAIVPYLALRGPVNRVIRAFKPRQEGK